MYPDLGTTTRTRGKLVLRRERVLISNKAVFFLSGFDVGDMSVLWRMAFGEVKRVLVKDNSVMVISKVREEVREVRMEFKEEAFLVYKKMMKGMESETERSLDHMFFTPAKIGESMIQLEEKLDERNVSKKKPAASRRLEIEDDKGKEEM